MKFKYAIAAGVLLLSAAYTQVRQKEEGEVWLTNADQSALFEKQAKGLIFGKSDNTDSTISINPKESYQSIDGFGFTLTGGSAQLMMQMSATTRKALITELFATDGNNIGISYLRVSIGASDLNAFVFSYDDMPMGETDMMLAKFDLAEDKKDVVPVLKEILTVNPKIKILGSPWSAPVWMKDNGDTRGGSLKPEYFDVYARYLAKYIQTMKKEGIAIDAITVQNEPLHPGNNPSMLMLAPDQAKFVSHNLGPTFKKQGIKTKIIIYDHNCDKPEYPISILNDAEAKKYVDGSAFHLYGGKIEALTQVHNAHSDRNVYFTEQWMGAPGNFKRDVKEHITKLTIGATRNWSRTVIEWNLAADPSSNPHTDRGGCDRCMGGITIDGNKITRNPAYYVAAHAAKFVRPGSVRIASNMLGSLPNVAFKTADGKVVLVVMNTGQSAQNFNVAYNGLKASASLNGGSVATYVFN